MVVLFFPEEKLVVTAGAAALDWIALTLHAALVLSILCLKARYSVLALLLRHALWIVEVRASKWNWAQWEPHVSWSILSVYLGKEQNAGCFFLFDNVSDSLFGNSHCDVFCWKIFKDSPLVLPFLVRVLNNFTWEPSKNSTGFLPALLLDLECVMLLLFLLTDIWHRSFI